MHKLNSKFDEFDKLNCELDELDKLYAWILFRTGSMKYLPRYRVAYSVSYLWHQEFRDQENQRKDEDIMLQEQRWMDPYTTAVDTSSFEKYHKAGVTTSLPAFRIRT